MYNRYLPSEDQYAPVEPGGERAASGGSGGRRGKLPWEEMLKKLPLEKPDSGDLLLMLIVLLLWKESGDTDLLLALGGAFLLGDDGEG